MKGKPGVEGSNLANLNSQDFGLSPKIPLGPPNKNIGEGMTEEKPENCVIENGDEKEKKEFKTTDHFLVPKHEIMTEKEKEKVMKKYNVTEKQFPKILHSDSVIKEIGAKIGDLIKITRDSQVAGEVVYYRIVSK